MISSMIFVGGLLLAIGKYSILSIFGPVFLGLLVVQAGIDGGLFDLMRYGMSQEGGNDAMNLDEADVVEDGTQDGERGDQDEVIIPPIWGDFYN